MFYTYFFLQSFLLVTCIFVGFKVKNSRIRNIYLWLFVVCFTLIEGLRFGRGIDYNVYYRVFDMHENGSYEYGQGASFLFDWLCGLLVSCELPYQALIIICSGILGFTGVFWLRRYPSVMAISLPWFFLLVVLTAENLFRWYTAFSFLLLGLDGLFNRNVKQYFIWLVCAMGFHIMIVFPAVVFFLIYKLERPLCSSTIAIVLYIIISIVWSTDFMYSFMSIANFFLSFFEHYAEVYGNNLESWMDGSYHGLIQQSLIRQILNFFFYAYLIIVGRKVVKYNPKLLLYYNIMLVGIIAYPALYQIELMDRFLQLFLLFQCLIGAYCVYYTIKIPIFFRKYLLYTFFVFVCLVQKTYVYLTPSNKYFTYYIWNNDTRMECFSTDYLDEY